MSSASRAVNRLRKQYRSVLAHMRESKSRLGSSACDVHVSHCPCEIEQLEPRLLLDGMLEQGFDFPGRTYAVGAYPESVTSVDVDKDGWADLVTANYNSNTVSVLRNLGNGTFAAQVTYAVGAWPGSVTSVDVDKDGWADLVTANFGGYSISVLRNLGNGTFAAQVTYTVGAYPYSVTSVDVNKDGWADLVTANVISGTVSVLRNLGNGKFAAQVTYAVGAQPRSVTSVDVDKDGWADLVTANYNSNTVSVLRNKGNGTFAAQVTYAVGTKPYSVTSVDVDKDGWADLVTANYGSYTVSVLRNQGNGTFAAQVTYAVGSGPYSVASVDVDKDGWADLVTANYSAITVSVLRNLGNGTFAAQVTYAVGNYPVSVTSVDVNKDGWADLVTANIRSDTVSVLRNQGNGTFAARVTYAVGAYPYSVTSVDVDKDGWADLVTANCDSDTVSVLRNQGNGTFAAKVTYTVGAGPGSVTSVDVDKDGWADLVTANEGSDSVSVLRNQGNGTFAAQVTYTVGAGPYSVTSVDVDKDGWADLVTANSGSDTVSVLRNQGNGTFAAQVTYAVGADPSSVTSADVDKDGWADLVTSNSGSGTVSVLRNLGNGTFAAKVTYAVGACPYCVTSVDVDKDGWADLVTANRDSYTLSVLRNLGNGTFAAQVTYAVGSNPISVTSADVDKDGWADLVTANYWSNTVSVLRNQGNGTFAAQATYAVWAGPYCVTSVDVDKDGWADLVTANRDSYTLSVLRNLGNVHPAAQQWVYNSSFLTDGQLGDYGAMAVEQVRSFLAGHNSYFRQPVADVDGVVFDMAGTIVAAANQYQINPQVLLATLQKESVAVTTSTRPSATRMALLMGAGAASTARDQVFEAARLYRAYIAELDANGITRSGWQVDVAKTTVDGVCVVPASKAVAALFTYTPYAGAQWGGNQPQWGGTYLFHYYWNAFGFGSSASSLPAPTGLAASAESDSAISLTWDAMAGATGYQLERRESAEGPWTTVRVLSAETTSQGAEQVALDGGVATLGAGLMGWIDSALSSIGTYLYRVAAYFGVGSSPYSRTASASPAEALTPRITSVDPRMPVAMNSQQPFAIYGENFDTAATVNLRDLDSGQPGGTLYAISADRLTITGNCITFNEDHGPIFGSLPRRWSVEVINPNERHDEYHFNSTEVPEELWTFMEHDQGLTFGDALDLRRVAYMLATAKAESGLLPVEEQEALWRQHDEPGEPRPYAVEDGVTGFRYFGRGYVQLTWSYNYKTFSFDPRSTGDHGAGLYDNEYSLGVNDLRADFRDYCIVFLSRLGTSLDTILQREPRQGQPDALDLYWNPDLAMEPEIAYAIMSFGMRKGLFTQSLQGLSHYIKAEAPSETVKREEYCAARSIVNPDEGDAGRELVATYAMHFEDTLNQRFPTSRNTAANNSFYGGSLAGWGGAGSGSICGGPDGAAVTCASPITLYQVLSTPPDVCELSVSYRFTTTAGTLAVMLDSAVLATITAPEAIQADPQTASVMVSDPDLLGRGNAVLAFRLDGPTGSQVLLSNIVLAAIPTGLALPEVAGYVIAGGLSQRSAVRDVGVSFTGDVSASLQAGSLVLENLDTGQPVEPEPSGPVYDAATNTAVWSFAELLPEGNYRATILADGLADITGTPVVSDYTFEFHVLHGDANGDRVVDAWDYIALKRTFGTTVGAGPETADLDGDGVVDWYDLQMLMGSFGTRGVAPAAVPAGDIPTAADAVQADVTAPTEPPMPTAPTPKTDLVAEPEPLTAPVADAVAEPALLTAPVADAPDADILAIAASVLGNRVVVGRQGLPVMVAWPANSLPPARMAVRVGPLSIATSSTSTSSTSPLLNRGMAGQVVADVLALAGPWWSGDSARRELPDEPWMTRLAVDITGKPRKGRLDPIGLDVLAVRR